MNTGYKDKIIRRIRAKKRGWVFTPKDFIDIASRNLIDVTLHRLVKQGMIRKLDKGIYDFPIVHQKLGILAPNPTLIAQAIVNKTGDILHQSSATVANQLGLDTQVPAKQVYITSRKAVKKKVGNYLIVFQHSKYTGDQSLTENIVNVVNVLRHYGKNNVSQLMIKQLSQTLSEKDKTLFLKNITKFPDWMAPVIMKLTRK